MAERTDIENFFRKLTLTCVNMHQCAFRESGFTSIITTKYWREQGSISAAFSSLDYVPRSAGSFLEQRLVIEPRLTESFSIYPRRTATTDFKQVTKLRTPEVKTAEHRSSFVSKNIDESPRKMSFQSKRDISATFTGNPNKSASIMKTV